MKASRIFPFILFLLLSCIPFTHAFQTVDTTVKTDKPTYLQGETITISGHVLCDAPSRPNLLLALWVKKQNGSNMIVSTTVQADEKGDFSYRFKLPENAESGIYEAYASTSIENKNATGLTTFKVEALIQPSNNEISEDHRILTLVMFVGILVALGVIASSLVFLSLSRDKRTREPFTVPRKNIGERYRKCVRCGKDIPSFYAFCPYCYTYQGEIDVRARLAYVEEGLMKTLKKLQKRIETLESERKYLLKELEKLTKKAKEKAEKLEDDVSSLREEVRSLKELLGNS